MIPKSQIKIKSTSGDEFKSFKGQIYIGEYMETSNGKFYAGTDNYSLFSSNQLYPISKESSKQLVRNSYIKKFDIIKKNIKDFLKNTQPIPSMKKYPLMNDYEKGYFIRYFTKRINSKGYQEIEKITYDSIVNKEGKYDHNLYEVGNIKWFLIDNVFKKNANSIQLKERKYKNISYLFPILNEFQRPNLQTQEDLYTNGKELYKADSTEYIGSYHIHSTQGPMVGAYHTNIPHPKLYYLNQLPRPQNMDYEDFLKNQTTLNPPTPELANPNIIRDTLTGTYNCAAVWGETPPGYIGLTNNDGLVPLSTSCIDPGDGTGTYNVRDYGDQALSTCQQECEGASGPINIGCLLSFDPNYCSDCNIHNNELCADNYINNYEETSNGDWTCFCGNYEGLPYYSLGCCTGNISYT